MWILSHLPLDLLAEILEWYLLCETYRCPEHEWLFHLVIKVLELQQLNKYFFNCLSMIDIDCYFFCIASLGIISFQSWITVIITVKSLFVLSFILTWQMPVFPFMHCLFRTGSVMDLNITIIKIFCHCWNII